MKIVRGIKPNNALTTFRTPASRRQEIELVFNNVVTQKDKTEYKLQNQELCKQMKISQ